MNYTLDNDEVILFEGEIGYNRNVVNDYLTLTNKKMVFEKKKGIFKSKKELIDIIALNDIKIHNNEVQCSSKGFDVDIQTIRKNIKLTFNGLINPKKICNIIKNELTGTNALSRGSDKVNNALNTVDETLGVDSRGVVKGFLENGIKGTLINGIKKKNK
ncbi:MAG: hypothetical protein VZS44_03295 [Bacilli bacterium]|nr:hypothetical protein [Bacilli bacterium]